MEVCQQESLRAQVPCKVPGPHLEAGTRYQRKPYGGQAQAGRGGG